MKKRAISPVVATVLLIALVVVIALILFLWFRGMIEEGVSKFGKNIKLVCDDVVFEASHETGTLNILNTGNVPIYKMKLRTYKADGFDTIDLPEWRAEGLKQGGSWSGTISTTGATKLILYPMLIGTSSKGKKTFICEGQYGKEVAL